MRTPRKITPHERYVAGRLAVARKIARLTQTQAGAALGITFQQIQKYENATDRISAGSLFVLAKLYGTPIEWFFEQIAANNSNEPSLSDLALKMIATPHGGRTIEAFMRIEHSADCAVVASVAEAIAPRQRAHLKAVG